MTSDGGATRWDERLIDALEGYGERGDRAALAALRRGLGKAPSPAPEVYPYVVPRLPREVGVRAEEAAYLIAALFALHPLSWKPTGEGGATNLGASFRRVWDRETNSSTEKRFVGLLNCHRDDLHEHLRSAVSLLRAHEVAVDWLRLLRDVRDWEAESRWVQRAWARAFWGT
ncbi:MAG: type I-E CRISPR-associated protein Cse2/CasB [Thermomicrobiales bacterium]